MFSGAGRREETIVEHGFFGRWRGFHAWRRMNRWRHRFSPQAAMAEDLGDHRSLGDKRDNLHFAPDLQETLIIVSFSRLCGKTTAFRAGQRIDLVNRLDQCRPSNIKIPRFRVFYPSLSVGRDGRVRDIRLFQNFYSALFFGFFSVPSQFPL